MTDPGHVLLVDDEEAMRTATTQWLALAGFAVTARADAAAALALLDVDFDGIVISDVKMPRMDGLAFQQAIARIDPEIPVLLVTGHGDVAMAVEAMRNGAYDFVEKPYAPDRLLDMVRRATGTRRLVLENRSLRRRLDEASGIERRLVGNAPAIRRLRQEIADIADTPASVLIEGATGTGKEVVARCLHEASSRARARFVAVNCAAIPETMFESELFGHEAGAFTGAHKRRIGQLEHASGGTLFLDEIGSMPLALQAKVLRALQEREIVRVGANDPIRVDIRLVSATNVNLADAVAAGRFRSDLYYRLNVVELRLPTLAERKDDLPLLFDYFAAEAARVYERAAPPLDPGSLALLTAHNWPGNVRELKNMAERYVLSSLPPTERLDTLLGRHEPDAVGHGGTLAERMATVERSLIADSLRRHHGNIQAVMDELGLPRRTLNQKMLNLGLDRRDYL
ncbi:sigma-54-dependent Fis family transcriptional regulator [Nitrogeniibacter mangrovi]|uniref:Sigma-54-dependent Fis family transcriptional regulator n=1 Tax=Nitrogeniibacter mangrovi TaxID=2016596 RepID=A0A6C1B2V9_9RHOO|nr:sigma-54 dependent transcriptional regulator [Nitrogeniibacter mangrovi]QID17966.1 sigma-54-dependent Fis family transcriptional regulator [Nitrogeniibacter mangrovi]